MRSRRPRTRVGSPQWPPRAPRTRGGIRQSPPGRRATLWQSDHSEIGSREREWRIPTRVLGTPRAWAPRTVPTLLPARRGSRAPAWSSRVTRCARRPSRGSAGGAGSSCFGAAPWLAAHRRDEPVGERRPRPLGPALLSFTCRAERLRMHCLLATVTPGTRRPACRSPGRAHGSCLRGPSAEAGACALPCSGRSRGGARAFSLGRWTAASPWTHPVYSQSKGMRRASRQQVSWWSPTT